MKKIFLGFAIIGVSLILANGAFAGSMTLGPDATSTTIGGANFRVSTSVTLMADSTATAWKASSKHKNGNKTFSANDTKPTVYETDSTVGDTLSAIVDVPTT